MEFPSSSFLIRHVFVKLLAERQGVALVVLLPINAGVYVAFPVLSLINGDDVCLQPRFQSHGCSLLPILCCCCSSLECLSTKHSIVFNLRLLLQQLLLYICYSLYNSRCSILRGSVKYVHDWLQLKQLTFPASHQFTRPAQLFFQILLFSAHHMFNRLFFQLTYSSLF